jgi:hypothetical protein
MDNEKDGRNTMTNFQLTQSKQYDFNMNKVQEYFDDNALMRIPFLKNLLLKFIDTLNSKKEEKIDIRVYMYFYLIIYDSICTIIVYIFIFFRSIMAGIIKIIFQLVRFYHNAKRLQRFNSKMNIFEIIKSKWENMVLIRGWSFFNPEGFLIIEFLCNFIVIFDIILLIKYICDRRRYKKIRKMNLIVDEEDDYIDEKENKNGGMSNENKENESNGESKPNENNNINIIKSGEGKLDSLFEKDDEDGVVSEEEEDENNINNVEKSKKSYLSQK